MRYRSVQTGVIFITFIGTILLITCLLLYYYSYTENQNKIITKTKEQRELLVNQVIQNSKETFIKVINENSAWDELQETYKEKDEDWYYENIGNMLESYNATYVAVINEEGKIQYERNCDLFSDKKFYTFIKGELPQYFKENGFLNYYYSDEEANVFEYFCAGIVSSKDIIERKEKEVGYLMMVRQINDSLLNEYGKSIENSKTSLVFDFSIIENMEKTNNEQNKNQIITYITLNNLYGNPTSYICFISENEIEKIFKDYKPVFFYISGFCILIFLLVALYFRLRVTRPLKKIAHAFQEGNSDNIISMKKNKTEFGLISNYIDDFFTQQNKLKELNQEISGQKAEMEKQNQELQQQKKEIGIQMNNVNVLNLQLSDRNKEMELKNTKILIQKSQIEEQAKSLELHKSELENLYHQMTYNNKQLQSSNTMLVNSMDKAEILKNAIMVSLLPTKYIFKDFFTLNLPKGHVSGDFYFSKRNENYLIVGIGDCNTQEAPGAILSSMTMYILDKILTTKGNDKILPNKILDELSEKLKSFIENRTKDEKIKEKESSNEEIYISILIYDFKEKIAYFSSARRSVIIIRDGDTNEYFGDSVSIGKLPENFKFSCQEIPLRQTDILYLYTDGCTEQIGGPYNRKISTVNFKKQLLKISVYPMQEQKRQLKAFYDEWCIQNERTDDITIFGFTI
ncbi:MAG: SpoIIE family protein phosphatase [Bacteroidales bacterium]|nr:SpoIIE family protein phosphatase [Bacteroidales bacterium]